MQDWSTCDRGCGGGTQTQHRVCVEPIGSGAPCSGNALITRPCNEQPCASPEIKNSEEVKENQVIEYKFSPVMQLRIQQLSSRPQRFEKCIIKETDVEIVRDDVTQFHAYPKVPGRAVLNNRTFSVFQTANNYETIIYSAQLKNIIIVKSRVDPEICFQVNDTSTTRHIILCGLSTASDDLTEIKAEWEKQILFFKNNCFHELGKVVVDPILEMRKQNNRKKQNAEMEAELWIN